MSAAPPEANCHSALSRMMASAHCCKSRAPTSMSTTATCTSWRNFGAPVWSSTGAPAGLSGRPRSQAAKLVGATAARAKPGGGAMREASVSTAAAPLRQA